MKSVHSFEPECLIIKYSSQKLVDDYYYLGEISKIYYIADDIMIKKDEFKVEDYNIDDDNLKKEIENLEKILQGKLNDFRLIKFEKHSNIYRLLYSSKENVKIGLNDVF